MVGIDFLKLDPPPFAAEQLEDQIVSLAKERKLAADLLSRLIELLASDKIRQKSHPFHVVFKAIQHKREIDAGFGTLIENQVKVQQEQHQKWLDDSTLFADFSNGIPDEWFQTGYAFGTKRYKANDSQFSNSSEGLKAPGTVTSGRFGSKFYGVLRSPTFEIGDGRIHYRYRGDGGTFRLVINNYRMDEDSALLYKGCISPIKPTTEFSWHLQSGDIPNHIGNSGNLELIDHFDGSFEVDEIRFSQKGTPVDPPSELDLKLAAADFDSQESFCQELAKGICEELKNDSNQIFDLLIAEDLTSLVRPELKTPSKKNASIGNLLSAQFVSSNLPGSSELNPGPAEMLATIDAIRKKITERNNDVPQPVFIHGMTDGTGEDEFIMIRGNHKALGEKATRRFLSAFSTRPLNPPDGSGRLLLANKITAPNNPLTTRVAVNRVWHHMFGAGIVKSVDNFGVLGHKPTHPELLDYLATDFAKNKWSIKTLIKKIAMSQTYQMASTTNPNAKTIDPDNKLLHRARIRRLQGEAIRDSMLSVSGRLDKSLYGPPVPIHLTPFMSGRGRPRKSGPLDGDGRRSIYIAVRRNFLSPMMLAFDTPIPFNATGRRNLSNVPAQSLILLNDPFVIGQARHWAEQLVKSNDETIVNRIEIVYKNALGRKPTTSESKQSVEYVKQQAKELGVAEDALLSNVDVWQDFCHAIFNVKEFIFIN